ncbi:MAG: gliding motility-associated C-terminal domain-containing protein [Bacteroidetes bacterium]|nr:gliding motility-associated C-terminal domain-containing protein [Bacteroidota bacterium]
MRKLFTVYTFLLFSVFAANSQCVNSFPYNESFESGMGAWISGGTSNDWTWGNPNKAFINNAGAGTKCWVTGGLTGSFYSNGERSYVVSPCFDFTNLPNPYISFLAYWECESTYDGATFQASIDNGITWNNIGVENEVTTCMSSNWFNSGNIINLNSLANPRSGWAGSAMSTSGSCQGGGGSNGWVLAKHCLNNLGGQPSVLLRFAFGAGTSCNNYDGFAFDEIKIENSTPVVADFSLTCGNEIREYVFTNLSMDCPDNFVWNFGDPASGTANGSGVKNPTHIFSAPGTYTVRLIASGPCNASDTITKVISTVGFTSNLSHPICFGDNNGEIGVSTFNTNGSINYYLQPGSIQQTTNVFNNLGAGVYTISIQDALGCVDTSIQTLMAPWHLVWSVFEHENISCYGLNDGALKVNAIGGNGNESYLLMPGNVNNTNGEFTSLLQGNYTIEVTDSKGCKIDSTFMIIEPQKLLLKLVNVSSVSCSTGEDGVIQTDAQGGTGTITFSLVPGNYLNENGSFSNLPAGNYILTCYDENLCTDSAAISLPALEGPCCDEVFVPNAFSPNNDGKNDEFAMKNVNAIELTDFLIYNRYGELAFKAQNINDAWNGHMKGIDAEIGTYYYMIRYRCNSTGKKYQLHGDVMLIR